MPQSAVSAELTVVSSLANATFITPFDSSLLRGYFNLDLDRQNAQKSMLSDVKNVDQSAEWTLPLMTKNDRVLPFILDNTPARLEGYFEESNVLMQGILRWPKTNASLDELAFLFPNTFVTEEKEITINLLPAPFVLPAIAQAPTQSNAPHFFSLVMLSVGGVALLGWLRTKRQRQRVYPDFHSKT